MAERAYRAIGQGANMMGHGRDLHKQATAFKMLFGMVFGLGALLSAWLAADEWLIVSSLQRHGVAAQGEVFDYEYQSGSGAGRRSIVGNYVPLIRFTTSEGQRITVRVNATNTQFPRGSYPLLYLPYAPRTARVESFVTMWMWSLILSAIALIMLLITIPLLLRSLKR